MRSIRIKNIHTNEEGTVAVEVAIIAPLLFAILFAVVELGILHVRMNVISDSVGEVSRIIKTGREFSVTGPTCANKVDCFVSQFCENVQAITKCKLGVNFSYEIKSYATLQDIGNDNTPLLCPSDSGGGQPSTEPSFDMGNSASIVRIRICYELPVINPYFGMAFRTLSNGNIRYAKTEIFANEPYQ